MLVYNGMLLSGMFYWLLKMPVSLNEPAVYIDTEEALRQLCRALKNETELAIDLEVRLCYVSCVVICSSVACC